MTVKEMMSQLKAEEINTWFDLGLFIDRFKEDNPIPTARFKGQYKEFKEEISKGGIAFVTFAYSVDGVTIEIEKYSRVFRELFERIPVHYIAGKFYPESEKLIHSKTKKYQIDEMAGFDDWDLYKDFYFIKLERGSKEYNELICKFREQVLVICEKLGKYIEKNNIKLLYLVNICSNPGNVCSTLAVALISEYLGIPVINNNHDFYWEGGNRKIDIITKGIEQGPRDFFFTNSDVGEFFSQIEVLFPWESRSWITVNINRNQTKHVIGTNGHNPANVMEIGTAIDTGQYQNVSKRIKINTFLQVEKVLSKYKKTLIAYSAEDVLNSNLINKNNPRPILIGSKTKTLQRFISENVVFLQPTRIISRKSIETGFKLIKRLFENRGFIDKFRESPSLKLTIIITGPIPPGQYDYLINLIGRFGELLYSVGTEFYHRVFLGLMFSELDKERFKKYFKEPIGVPELYSIASLVLLPSETEGRGLPIIEATSSGVPIFCRRYYPETVYSEVIGEHLPERDRLKVIEYDGNQVTDNNVENIIERVFYPHKFIEEVEHNRAVVQNRYSLESLRDNMEQICYRLFLQLKSSDRLFTMAANAIKRYDQIINIKNNDLNSLINTKNRHYLPGYGRLAFMFYLKSLIDPSYFRVEQQEFRGIALSFASALVTSDPEYEKIPVEKLVRFYNVVDNIFNYTDGEIKIRHDHSFAYRHRNKSYYPYQKYTIEELMGLINLLYNDIIQPKVAKVVEQSPHFFTDWNLALSQLTSSSYLAIDDRERLIRKIKSNVPIAYFPGKYVKYELDLFALQTVRERLDLPLDEELTEDVIKENASSLAPVFVFAQEAYLGKWHTADDIKNFIVEGSDRELKLLHKHGILRIIKTYQLCVGIHFPQLGKEALRVLRQVMEQKGFILSNRRNAAMMTDIVNIDRFHIGRATYSLASNIMGIPINSGYIQYVPAGIRTTLAYPVPIQTAKDFHEILKSDLYKDMCKKYGEEKVLDILREDAETKGSPVEMVLENLKHKDKKDGDVGYSYVSGVYFDGLPWNGAIAKAMISRRRKKWGFATVSGDGKTKKVTTFIQEFERKNKNKACIAWNGGYILNAELVGKLGLPESYIGSPLGLLISGKKVLSPPLFNKPALLIYENGSIDIDRVSSCEGIVVKDKKAGFDFSPDSYNCCDDPDLPCYYDLMYDSVSIEGNGRVIVRLAGNVIKEVIHTKKNEKVNIIPVGLTLSFPKDLFPSSWDKTEKELDIEVKGLGEVLHAVEAGPMLVDRGKFCLDMEGEGWKTENSIRTQAARIDYTDMRGPKIAVGIDKKGDLSVLTINGRIRESVGATHVDMAEIMIGFGMQKAMGFDPGGSSTLVVNGKVLNISPYNSQYEKNVYSLPPEPRAVSNAVIGYIEK